ncbi:MAG: hypothetical protein Q8R76_02280 [Candidatus Omnitrophota bacterium]|nr:hypothetical protein [Candidatus Omnitrophota bacterium]
MKSKTTPAQSVRTPQEISAQWLREHADFLLPCLALLAINLPFFSYKSWFHGDTIHTFEIFYGSYTNFFYHWEFPWWFPFGSFGIRSDLWQVGSVSGSSYLMGVLGALVRFQDAATLFKLRGLVDQYLLLLGVHLLSRRLFQNKWVSSFVCLGIILSAFWVKQSNYELRLVYLVPFVLYFMYRFFENEGPHFLWLAGTTYVLAQPGTPPYMMIAQFLALLPIFVSLSVKNRRAFLSLRILSTQNVLSFILFALSLIVYFTVVLHMLDGFASIMPHRDLESRMVPLESFLAKGPTVWYFPLLQFLYAPSQDTYGSAYMGIFPLVFVIYALLRMKNIFSKALLMSAVLMLTLAMGRTTFVATVLYHLFPPVAYLGDLTTLGAIIRVLLMLLAGFGLDWYLDDLKSKKSHNFFGSASKTIYVCAEILLVLFACGEILNRSGAYIAVWHQLAYLGASLVFFGTYLITKRKTPAGTVALAIILIALELFTFQVIAHKAWPYRWGWVNPVATRVYPFEYQEKRAIAPDLNPRMIEAAKLVEANPVRLFLEVSTFLLFDACLPKQYPIFHWNERVHHLLVKHFPDFHKAPGAIPFIKSKNSWAFFQVFGCSRPKLKLVANALYATSEAHALAMFSSIKDFDDLIIVETSPAPGQEEHATEFHNTHAGIILRVRNYSFNGLSVDVDVTRPEGAWLYYSDAYHNGWRGYIDGAAVPIVPANIAFKAIHVPSGTHAIRFAFFPQETWWATLGLALLSLAFITTLLALGTYHSRTIKKPPLA